jgi:hypothetical protein
VVLLEILAHSIPHAVDWPPLFDVCYKGSDSDVTALVQDGVDVNCQDQVFNPLFFILFSADRHEIGNFMS